MWATSDEYLGALASHNRTWYSKVEVLYGGSVVETLSVVSSGAVSIDEVAVRRSLDITFVDADGALTPASAKDLLAPKGTEVRIYKGLLVEGVIEWVPLGVFGVEEPNVSAHQNGTIVRIRASDRAASVKKRRFVAPYTVAKNTPTTDAIAAIVTSRLTVPVRATVTGNTTPEVVYDELSDPWDAIQALSTADALRTYFDPLGTLIIEPEGEVDTGITYAPGESSLLVSSTRSLLADKTYSGVIVKGEHPDYPPVRYEKWDTDPASPTYAAGPFGYQPYGFTSPLITSLAMATTTADTLFDRVTRMRQDLSIEMIGHPGHDVGDVVTVTDAKSKTSGRYTIYGASIPLRLGVTSLRLREALA